MDLEQIFGVILQFYELFSLKVVNFVSLYECS
jgi:hypothetical protein